MKAAFWLAWQELRRRKVRFLISVVMVAMAVSLCVATELISISREAAIAAKIDNMGPAIRLVPAGITASDLAQFELGGKSFDHDTVPELRKSLSKWIRALEGRALLKYEIEGVETPIVGVIPEEVVSPFKVLSKLEDANVAIGIYLADRLGKKVGDSINFRGHDLRISSILPETGNVDDISIFMNLNQLKTITNSSGLVNEVRIFLKAGTPSEEVANYLKSNFPGLNVIVSSRGDVAEHEIGDNLEKYRWVFYLITAVIIAASIIVSSLLNVSERKLEVSTLVVIGAPSTTVLMTLVMRAGIIGIAGALVGYMLGASIMLIQDFSTAINYVFAWNLFFVVVIGTGVISMFSAGPASILAVHQDHIKGIQEQ